MLFKPLATGVTTLVSLNDGGQPSSIRVFQNSLCTGYVGFKGFGAGVFWRQREGEVLHVSFCLLLSSSTCGNSRLHNGKGSCAGRPRSQTGSRMSALLPSGSCGWK